MKQYYKIDQAKSGSEWDWFVQYWDADLQTHMKNTARTVSKIPNLRFLGLTGPTCSGKTTAAKILTEYLETHGRRVHVISLDDFYYENDYLQRRAANNPDIEIDYDSEETINHELFAEKIASLMENKPTEIPKYDFKCGKQTKGGMIEPEPEDVFLVEGIQVLYPKIDCVLRKAPYRSIYICASSGIEIGGEYFEPNEIRLMRRIVRDYHFRAAPPAFSFYLWQSVRSNEEKSIFPNMHACDYFIDSTMPYEIGMLKPYLEAILAQMPREDRFYQQAARLLQKLKSIQEVDSNLIAENSLYKEFI